MNRPNPVPSLRHRAAFTLVELLVVIAIIGVLVGLLLPAVQAAREAARRSQCQTNLTQLGLAISQYEMAHGAYPPGTIAEGGPVINAPNGYHHNWISQILPYIEQKNAYEHLDRSVSVYHPNNRPVRQLGIRLLQCPSSPYGGKGYSSYAGLQHDVEAPIDVDNNGIFFLNSRITMDEVGDGTSQTFFVGEKLTLRGDLGWLSGTRATLRNTGTPINAALRGGLQLQGPPGPPTDGSMANEDDMDNMGVLQYDADLELYTAEDNPAVPQEDALGMPAPGASELGDGLGPVIVAAEGEEPETGPIVRGRARTPTAVGGFASTHSGGANFVMGDGSIRFVSETIDMKVYQQLGHRDDGQLLQMEF